MGLAKEKHVHRLPNGEATTEDRRKDDRVADHTASTPPLPHYTIRQGPCHAIDVTMHLRLHHLPVRPVSPSADIIDCPARRTCTVPGLRGRSLSPSAICETVLLERWLDHDREGAAWRLFVAHVCMPMLQITVEAAYQRRTVYDRARDRAGAYVSSGSVWRQKTYRIIHIGAS